VGNSFTYADESPVQWFEAATIHDLSGERRGGVPALFRAFANQVGADYDVALEALGGARLMDHLAEQHNLLDARWDVVVLQDYSTLDPDKPGDPTQHIESSGQLARMFLRNNAHVRIFLVAVWPRADQIYEKDGHWYRKPIDRVALELRAASDLARKEAIGIERVIPVGEAWTRAMRNGLADLNPYDGRERGTIDLWAKDHYHGSSYGYYLSALTIFGAVTQCDPRGLGKREGAAKSLGIPASLATALQAVASEELARSTTNLRTCSRTGVRGEPLK
jgi:hypothetical protein